MELVEGNYVLQEWTRHGRAQNIQKKVEIHTVCNAASLGLLRGIPWSTAFFFGPMME